ncbi:hypothetical protein V8G54_006626 [Vigna mungo]|uniref:Uncharacterized protein n=1 Tax=Vigna mungo TaxID=3915 RepID=A0AAQ3P066_VIGMU
MQPAASTPIPRKNSKPVLKAPRHLGGAISERYSGAAFSKFIPSMSTVNNKFEIVETDNKTLKANLISKANSEAKKDTTKNEHKNILCGSIKCSTNKKDGPTQHDGVSSAKLCCYSTSCQR